MNSKKVLFPVFSNFRTAKKITASRACRTQEKNYLKLIDMHFHTSDKYSGRSSKFKVLQKIVKRP